MHSPGSNDLLAIVVSFAGVAAIGGSSRALGSIRRVDPRNVVLSLGVTLGLLVLGEGWARLSEPARRRPERDETRPTALPDDLYVMESASPGWPRSDRFNRDGVRDRPHSTQKLRGRFRLVCLGDSVTYGPDDDPQAAFPQRLDRLLGERSPHAEVYNVAIWGWSTFHERLAYERIARRHRPDLVLLGVCLNDIPDLLRVRRPPHWLLALHRASALVRRLVAAREQQAADIEELFADPDSDRVQAAWSLMFEELDALHAAVAEDGARLAIAVFPFRPQLGASAPPPVAQERLRDYCAARGVPFLDLRAALAPLGEGALEPGDGIHFVAEAHARIAEAVLSARLLPDRVLAPQALLAASGRNALGDAGDDDLLPWLGHAEPDVRAEAAWALGRRGDASVAIGAALGQLLDDDDASVREAATTALGERGDGDAVITALLSRLDDPHQAVRWSAARALDRLSERLPLAPERLAPRLDNDDDYVRAFAAWTLGVLGEAAAPAVPALVRALNDPDPGVRAVVIRALGRVGGDAAIAALVRTLSQGDPDQRWRAARALGRHQAASDAARVALEAAQADPDERVREAARLALSRRPAGDEAERAGNRKG